MAIAKLTIEVEAALAKFETDMRRVATVAEGAFNRIGRAGTTAGAVFKGSLLAGAAQEAVTGIVRLVPSLVEGVARFQDLEEQTGASAEALAAMQTPADVAGLSIDELAGFMVKLTGTLSKTNDESKGAGLALSKLGLELQSFRGIAPEEQFKTLAERLNALPTGANRTAIALGLLGKQGAQALPFLKELAQTGLSQNRVSAEQIRLADELVDRNAKLRSELKQAAQVAAIQLLPAFNALFEEISKGARAFVEIDNAADKLTGNSALRSFAEGAAEGFAVLADAALFAGRAFNTVVAGAKTAAASLQVGIAAGGIANGFEGAVEFVRNGTGPLKDALDARNAAVAESNKQLANLLKADDFGVSTGLRERFAAERLGRDAGADSIDKLFKRRGGGGGAEDLSGERAAAGDKAAREADQLRKARADEALRALQRTFGAEQDAVKFQQRFLEAQYAQGTLSLEEFYARRAELNQRALQTQLQGFDAEAAALRQSLSGPSVGEVERVRITGRIADVEAKAAEARAQYASDEQVATIETAKAYTEASDRVIEFRAQVLELQGDLEQAAKLRTGLAIEQARRSATSTGITAEDLSRFEAATRAAMALGDAQRNVQRISGDLATEEERIAIAARTSGASRSQVEAQLYALRQRALQQMAQELRVAEQLAASADPDSPTVQFARQLRLEFERLNEVIDPALVRLRQVGDEVADALGQAAGAITLNFKDAASAVKSLEQTLLQIGTRELVTEPLTDFFRQQIRGLIGAGQGGGIGGALGDIFGVRGGGVTAPAITSPTDAERSAIGALFEVSGPAADAAGDAALAASITASAATISATVTTSEATSSAAIVTAISTGSAAQVAAFSAAIAASTTAIVASIAASGASQALGGAIPWDLGFAAGGPIHGPGTATSDSIPILASAGEFMVRAHAAQQPGAAPFLARFNTVGMRAVEELLKRPRFADGGFIGASTPRLHRGYANGGSVWRGAVERMVQASAPGETTRNQHFDMRGLRVDSQGAMDRMAEDRAAIAITRKAQRRLARHLA